ncbi:MAG TPA: tetratricopeptide repeat protein [Steroidobacteraceae bacterium]|nr:tetratricopeptide repeat protein [Steroidobacteraceae bacterium]
MLTASTGRQLARTAFALVVVALAACGRDSQAPLPAPAVNQVAATYLGGAVCVTCHAAEADLWRKSHHALAMQPADATTVLANFADTTFTKDGVVSTFFRRDGGYYVRTDGADGRLAEFRVAYTFGVQPLQQYLLELPQGRLQALSIAWDARAKEAGGQRWFHLYPGEKIDHRDVLHWTGPAQNWNHMCADCHSTHLEKNYRAGEDRFETKWTDVNVSCEACHGPGSLHMAWARAKDGIVDPKHGFAVALENPVGHWAFQDGDPIAKRQQATVSPLEVDTCGRCHARRAQLLPGYRPGDPLEQAYRAATLDEGLYFDDGQNLDEVYEYGSFLQSRMFAQGVTCSNCHEPHSGQLRAADNAVCAQCHQASHYDSPKHHFHNAGTDAARCVSCHMVERKYMVIDGRRDHSFRVPRPDLSAKVGAPDACTGCHVKRDASWAAARIVQWYGPDRLRGPRYAVAIHAGRVAQSGAEQSLASVATDTSMPAVARATAISLLPPYLSAHSLPAIAEAAKDEQALVRRAAMEAMTGLDPQTKVPLAFPLLSDPVRSVRLEALGNLLDSPSGSLSAGEQKTFDAVVAEYREVQSFNADRADARVNLGMLEMRLGNAQAAEQAFEAAIRLQPSFVPSYVNLADLYRSQGEEGKAEQALRAGLKVDAQTAELHEALGLALVRQKRLPEASSALARAAQLQPDNVRYAYVHAIALHELGDVRGAIQVLEQAHRRFVENRDIVMALVDYNSRAGDRAAARRWAKTLAAMSPDDREAQELLRRLGGD